MDDLTFYSVFIASTSASLLVSSGVFYYLWKTTPRKKDNVIKIISTKSSKGKEISNIHDPLLSEFAHVTYTVNGKKYSFVNKKGSLKKALKCLEEKEFNKLNHTCSWDSAIDRPEHIIDAVIKLNGSGESGKQEFVVTRELRQFCGMYKDFYRGMPIEFKKEDILLIVPRHVKSFCLLNDWNIEYIDGDYNSVTIS